MKLRVAFEWLYLLFIITVRKTDDSSMWLEAQGFSRTKKRSNEMVITNNTVMNVSEWNKLVCFALSRGLKNRLWGKLVKSWSASTYVELEERTIYQNDRLDEPDQTVSLVFGSVGSFSVNSRFSILGHTWKVLFWHICRILRASVVRDGAKWPQSRGECNNKKKKIKKVFFGLF